MIFLRPSQQWHYATKGQRQGPIGSDELRRLALEERLGKEDLVWSKGMQDWVSASTIDGLFPKASPTSAATPSTIAATRPKATTTSKRTSKVPMLFGIGLALCAVAGAAGYWAWRNYYVAPLPDSATSTGGNPTALSTHPAEHVTSAPQSNNQNAVNHSAESASATGMQPSTETAAASKDVPQSTVVRQSSISPSFDCRKASTVTEHAICDSPQLSSLDGELGAVYSDLIASTPADQLRAVRMDQASWLKSRDADCNGDAACLDDQLRQRVALLKHTKADHSISVRLSSQPKQTPQTEPTVSRAVDAPVSIDRSFPPKYPAKAVREHHTGRVGLKVLVGRDGNARDITIESSSGHEELDRAAIAAVQTWIFNPARKDGSPVESYLRIPVDFRLKD